MLLGRVSVGASSSAVEQRTHNPTGRRFESYLAYFRERHSGGAAVIGGANGALPLPRTRCYDYTCVLRCLSDLRSEEGLHIALKDA